MGNCCARPTKSEDGKTNTEPQHLHSSKADTTTNSSGFGLHMGNCSTEADTTTNNSSGDDCKSTILENPTGDISLLYNLGRELGRGQFGITYLCTDIETSENYACKSISKAKLITERDVEDVRNEVEIMKYMPEHLNIVSFKGAFEDDEAVHIVMELCEGGELFDRIDARSRYTERDAAAVMKTILKVVQVCHDNRVMHRDLKPENFLFANTKVNSPLKVIDFGLSVFFEPGDTFDDIVGSPYYMAPEVLKKKYGPEVDIWSAGVILYIMLCGVPPFWAATEEGVAQAILSSVIDFKRDPWPKVSDTAKDLVRKMLEPDPKKRLSAARVLKHPWIRNAKEAPNVSLGGTVKDRLKQFSVMNKLKKKALRVIADCLSVDEVDDMREAFDMIDSNKTGKITLEQLKKRFHELGHPQIPDADLEIWMEAAGEDGTITYSGVVAVSVHIRKMANDQHLYKAFSFFDKNGSGYIETEDLWEALNDEMDTSSEDVIAAIMRDVDTDKDGRISYEEFAAMMKAGTDWRKASREYSRERFKSLRNSLVRDGSLSSEGESERK